MKYEYPAIFYAENGGYSVIFPDVEGAITQGKDEFDAMGKAREALAEILIAYENFQAGRDEEMTNKISAPTVPEKIPHDDNGTFMALVKIDTDEYRKKFYPEPERNHELWYSPKTKKYYTMLADDDAEVLPKAEESLREVSGVK